MRFRAFQCPQPLFIYIFRTITCYGSHTPSSETLYVILFILSVICIICGFVLFLGKKKTKHCTPTPKANGNKRNNGDEAFLFKSVSGVSWGHVMGNS